MNHPYTGGGQLTGAERTRIRELARPIRSALAEAVMFADEGNLNGAYGAAERAQHLSWELKSEIDRIAAAHRVPVGAVRAER